MIKLIRELFKEQGYEPEDLVFNEAEALFLTLGNPEGHEIFYLVCKVNELSDDMFELYSQLRKTMKEKEKSPSMDKNTSLIILLDLKDKEKKSVANKIADIEEDPYYFKKFVLEYKKSEVDDLVKWLDGKGEKKFNKDACHRLIMEQRYWNDDNSEYHQAYQLLIRLFIKLSLLDVPQFELEFGNLDDEIIKDLEEKPDELMMKNAVSEFGLSEDGKFDWEDGNSLDKLFQYLNIGGQDE